MILQQTHEERLWWISVHQAHTAKMRSALARLGVALLLLITLALGGCGTVTGSLVDSLDWTCPTRWVETHYDDRTEVVCAETGKRLVLRAVQP